MTDESRSSIRAAQHRQVRRPAVAGSLNVVRAVRARVAPRHPFARISRALGSLPLPAPAGMCASPGCRPITQCWANEDSQVPGRRALALPSCLGTRLPSSRAPPRGRPGIRRPPGGPWHSGGRRRRAGSRSSGPPPRPGNPWGRARQGPRLSTATHSAASLGIADLPRRSGFAPASCTGTGWRPTRSA